MIKQNPDLLLMTLHIVKFTTWNDNVQVATIDREQQIVEYIHTSNRGADSKHTMSFRHNTVTDWIEKSSKDIEAQRTTPALQVELSSIIDSQ